MSGDMSSSGIAVEVDTQVQRAIYARKMSCPAVLTMKSVFYGCQQNLSRDLVRRASPASFEETCKSFSRGILDSEAWLWVHRSVALPWL